MANGNQQLNNPKQQDVLQILGEILGKGAKNVGGIISRSNPVAALGQLAQLAGTASTIVPGQNQQDFQLNQFDQQRLENAQKTILKNEAKQITEAQEAGVPANELANQAVNMIGLQPTSGINPPTAAQLARPGATTVNVPTANQALTGTRSGQPESVQQQFPGNVRFEPGGVFQQQSISTDKQGNIVIKPGGFFNLMGTGNIQGQLAAASALQTMRGQEPLQVGEGEKIALEGLNAIRKEALKSTIEAEKAGNLKPEHLLNSYEKLAKPWREVQGSFGRLKSSMVNPATGELDFSGWNPAGDLDLLFGTAKTLDPGGRVTDSDVAIQTLMTGKFGDKLAKIAQKMRRGGSLAPGERKALYKAAEIRYKSDKNIMNKSVKELERKAIRNKIDPQKVISQEGFAPENTNTQIIMEDAQGNRALVDLKTQTVIREL